MRLVSMYSVKEVAKMNWNFQKTNSKTVLIKDLLTINNNFKKPKQITEEHFITIIILMKMIKLIKHMKQLMIKSRTSMISNNLSVEMQEVI